MSINSLIRPVHGSRVPLLAILAGVGCWFVVIFVALIWSNI
jgi:hypothetical protein